MTALTPDAQELFNNYLQRVRWSVRGIAGADEIEHNVREHVASALENAEEPISSSTLRDVLSRLGDPWEWVPAEDLPLWRRVAMRFSVGPEDWRLSYLCFGLTLLGFLMLPVGVGVFVLFGAFFLARAALDLASDRGNPLDSRRWLIYPPLLLFYFVFALILVVALPGSFLAAGTEEHFFEQFLDHSRFNTANPLNRVAFHAALGSLIVGSWWIVLSGLIAVAVRPLRFIFSPFANRLRRVHALWLTAIGVVLAGLGAGTLFFGS